MIVYTHQDCLLKYNGKNHPERRERLDSIITSIKSSNLNIILQDAPMADLETISLVHPKKHIEQIFANIPKKGIIGVEKEPYADTMLCPNSKKSILRSCGAGLAACDNLMTKNERAFCAVRPPGHHAETIRANGFCFVNNIAVAARYLQKKYEINKIDHELFSFTFDILKYYSLSNLVITRAGSSALAELLNCNIPIISIPLPSSAENHQLKNAQYFMEKGFGNVVEEKDIHNKLFNLLQSIHRDKSMLNTIKINQKKHSDKNVFLNINKEITKLFYEN